MTMIIGIIAKTGILLASDTRCMISDRGNFLGYHEHARKIAVSSQMAPVQIACAIACSVSGLSLIEDAQRYLSKHRYSKDTLLRIVHSEFEQKYKVISKSDPSVRVLSITSIFAKFESDRPCLSYGTLSNTIETKAPSGVLSCPQIRENAFENQFPTKDQAIQFVKDKITERANIDVNIGSMIDIVYLTPDETEWVQGEHRLILPVKTKDLYGKYKEDPSIITLLQERHLLEEWFENHSY